MRKKLLILLITLCALCCVAGIAACGVEEHVWDTEWKHNSQMHWHDCTNSGCNERADVGGHEGWTLVEVIEPATCLERGTGLYACSVCGYTKEDIIESDPDAHVYDETVPWTKDAEGHWRVCTEFGCNHRDFHAHSEEESVPRTNRANSVNQDGEIGYYCDICSYQFRTEISYATGVPTSFKVNLDNTEYPAIPGTEELEEGIDAELSLCISQEYEFSFINIINAYGAPASISGFYEYVAGFAPTSGLMVYLDDVLISNIMESLLSRVQNAAVRLKQSGSLTLGNAKYFFAINTKTTGDYNLSFSYYAPGSVLSETFKYTIKLHILSVAAYRKAASAASTAASVAQSIDLDLPPEFRKSKAYE